MTPSSAGAVVVGGGPAASRCAFALRKRGFADPVTLLCAEPVAPYDRTMVSKDLLLKRVEGPELLLAPHEAYSEARIDLRLGATATGLDVDERCILLADGEQVPYASVVIATGGHARLPAALDGPGVHVLRTVADARGLDAALRPGCRLVIVGGGLIAGELATAALARGAGVVMLEALEVPLVRLVGPEIGERVAALHRDAGVDLRVRTKAERIAPGPSGYEVVLEGGGSVTADVVVVAAGMVPAVDWLRGTPGLEIDDGVVTDELCRTGVPGVLAAGDCARWYNGALGCLTRVEHWDSAVRHGEAAAATLTGDGQPFAPVPFVWSVQQGVRLQWVGDSAADRVEIEETETTLVARHFRSGELCGGFAMNDARAVARIRRELQERARLATR